MITRRRLLQSLSASVSLATLAPRALRGGETGGVVPVPGRDPIDDPSQEFPSFRMGAGAAATERARETGGPWPTSPTGGPRTAGGCLRSTWSDAGASAAVFPPEDAGEDHR